eukprot:Ihof_evm13s90 gene=Ihof_evmTU13s90
MQLDRSAWADIDRFIYLQDQILVMSNMFSHEMEYLHIIASGWACDARADFGHWAELVVVTQASSHRSP